MIFKINYTWGMVITIDIGMVIMVICTIYYNIKNHLFNPVYYIIPNLLYILSGIQCLMMQMLLETNLRELLVGFGHNLDNGSITISFGMLFMADLMTALIYCGKKYEANANQYYTGGKELKWLLSMLLLIFVNFGWLYIWKEVLFITLGVAYGAIQSIFA